ncbi:MAG: phenylacetate--CoA ligase family protein [Deltaproteobacteria bacterium]|nr:MAG: phenylacetate--CoA ligase family protein [Deltaproteobacteria bacterium]
MGFYRPLLEKVLFPVLEAAHGRPTVPLLQFLRGSERWSLDALRDLQAGLLRRLIRHAAVHTVYYRKLLDERGMHADDIRDASDLCHLPLLDREAARETLESRTADEPRWVIEHAASALTGAPVVKYNAESRHWRDATRWRAYRPAPASWLARVGRALDRRLMRDLHIDCVVRSERALEQAASELAAFRPEVMVAYAAGASALARYINDHGLRSWRDIPVIIAAERLWPHDRTQIAQAFGPVFETYGCSEVMLIGAECEIHDGLHTSMENLIVELIVREPGGAVRAARPGEVGEVAITDLHNLACPMIRYVTGEVAIARAETRCPCGRGLAMIGPIDGRISEALYDRGDEIPLTSTGWRKVVTVESAADRIAMLA